MNWNLSTALCICRDIEAFCSDYGCHVALTGGCLYKEGDRKDLDLLFYRIRQVPEINVEGLVRRLEQYFKMTTCAGGFGFCYKLDLPDGRKVDLFFPESQGGDYDVPADDRQGDRLTYERDLLAEELLGMVIQGVPQGPYGTDPH